MNECIKSIVNCLRWVSLLLRYLAKNICLIEEVRLSVSLCPWLNSVSLMIWAEVDLLPWTPSKAKSLGCETCCEEAFHIFLLRNLPLKRDLPGQLRWLLNQLRQVLQELYFQKEVQLLYLLKVIVTLNDHHTTIESSILDKKMREFWYFSINILLSSGLAEFSQLKESKSQKIRSFCNKLSMKITCRSQFIFIGSILLIIDQRIISCTIHLFFNHLDSHFHCLDDASKSLRKIKDRVNFLISNPFFVHFRFLITKKLSHLLNDLRKLGVKLWIKLLSLLCEKVLIYSKDLGCKGK